MTKLDYSRRRPQPNYEPAPVRRSGPTRERKPYPTERAAQSAADYLNAYGKQRALWAWEVRVHELHDGKWELWRVPRTPDA